MGSASESHSVDDKLLPNTFMPQDALCNFCMRFVAYGWLHAQSYGVYMGGEGGTQAYSRLSTTHGHITDCMLDSVVYACELMWTCLVWTERSTPDNF